MFSLVYFVRNSRKNLQMRGQDVLLGVFFILFKDMDLIDDLLQQTEVLTRYSTG